MRRIAINLTIILGFLFAPFFVLLPWIDFRGAVSLQLGVVLAHILWWAGRLLPLIGLYVLLIEALPAQLGNRVFRSIALALAFLFTTVAFFSFLTPLFHPLQVLPVPIAGLLMIRAPTASTGKEGPAPFIVGGTLLLLGLALLFLTFDPTKARYASWKPNGPLSLENILYHQPVYDFELALASGDLKAICLSGVGLVCPPYTRDEGYLGYKAMDHFGYRGVAGYSDAIMNGPQRFLQKQAYKYAETFNALLLDHLEQSGGSRRSPEEGDSGH
ncbi:MAG: hypothetical protein K0U98_28440 [Deltaproteobacteria bacterium]|nr:hypothetical protein [Deltaproteobacteria bacterium]